MTTEAQFVWDALHFRTPAMLAVVERLTDEELRWQRPNGANPIAWMLWHIPEVEDNWVRRKLYGSPNRYPFGASVKATPLDHFPRKRELLTYFHEVRALTRQRLEESAEAAFGQPLQDDDCGGITVGQLWAGVVTSAAWHGGQIAYVRRLLP